MQLDVGESFPVLFVTLPSLFTPTALAQCCFHRCLSVFPDDIAQTDAARITKTEGSTMGLGNPSIYSGIKMSKVKVTKHKKTVPAWVFGLL